MAKQLASAEWEAEIGQQLRALRLRHDLDQRRLADQAGVALNVVKNLEAGKGSTLHSFVKVLRALDRADWLETLAPPVSISPLHLLKARSPRRRVSRKQGPEGSGNV
jgi:transcriptional regulator with XRE-family HTH domain